MSSSGTTDTPPLYNVETMYREVGHNDITISFLTENEDLMNITSKIINNKNLTLAKTAQDKTYY